MFFPKAPCYSTGSGVYIHIPFCKSKCPYCNFYSIEYDKGLAASYVNVLLKQINGVDCKLSTIYIGGGTPTVLDIELLEDLLRGLKRYSSRDIEFTIEVNPESITREKLDLFLASGVNRLSLGVQSFSDDKLRKLGRIHSAACAKKAIHMALDSGFRNISIDLIFGVWDETIEDWQEELEIAVGLPLMHISCYALTYEADTALFAKIKNGRISRLEDEAAAKMYEWTMRYLPEYGFRQYEISSFAKEGYYCRHNFSYWENNSYLGIGASAVSYRDGLRQENIRDVKEYIVRFKEGRGLTMPGEELGPKNSAHETAALKIRTNDGIDYCWFREKTGFDFIDLEASALRGLAEDGLIAYKHEGDKIAGICLTAKGMLFCDTVSSRLL